jgi:hypothetical protein
MTRRHRTNWRKSSYSSGANSMCVEVSPGADTLVRDSKFTAGPALAFDAGCWLAFVGGVSSRADLPHGAHRPTA